MASIRIGGIEEAQTLVVAVLEQVHQSFHTERSLMGMMPHPDGAGAHRKPAGLNAGAAEGHGIGGGKFLGKRGRCECPGSHFRSQPDRGDAAGRSGEEFSAFHRKLLANPAQPPLRRPPPSRRPKYTPARSEESALRLLNFERQLSWIDSISSSNLSRCACSAR